MRVVEDSVRGRGGEQAAASQSQRHMHLDPPKTHISIAVQQNGDEQSLEKQRVRDGCLLTLSHTATNPSCDCLCDWSPQGGGCEEYKFELGEGVGTIRV